MATYPLFAAGDTPQPPQSASPPGPQLAPQTPAQTIPGRTVCLTVTLKAPGNRRKVSTAAVEADTDKSMLHVSKDLLDSEEYKAIGKIDGETRRYVAEMALPFPFRPGFYLLPYDLLERVDAKLGEYQQRRAAAVDCFVRAYPQRQREAADKLGPLYDPTDYPPASEIEKAFSLSWSYLAFDVPGQLQTINRDVWERQQAEMASMWREAAEECRAVLRAKFAELIGRAVERLTPGPDGKQKIFRDSLIGNLDEFLETFAPRNITDDAELQKLVAQARELTRGINPNTLRQSTRTREKVAEGFEQINRTLAEMIQDAPRRAFSFED